MLVWGVGREVLVEDQDRPDPAVLEERIPGGLLDQDLVEQMGDRAVVEAQLRPVLLEEALVGRRVGPSTAARGVARPRSSRQVAVWTAFQSETAWRTLFARTTRTNVRSGKDGRQQLREGRSR